MSNKGNASIWVIIGLLVVAGVLLFVFSDDGEGTDNTGTTTDQTTEQDADSESVAQVEEALRGGSSVECTYTGDEEVTSTSYIKDGEIRTIAEAEATTSNMLFSDEQIYVWEDGATEGIIFSATTSAESSNRTPMPVRPGDVTEAAASANVSCTVTDVNDDLFVLPDGVEFMAFSESSTESDSSRQEIPQR